MAELSPDDEMRDAAAKLRETADKATPGHLGLAKPLAVWLDQAALAFTAWGDDALDYEGLAVARAINAKREGA